MFYEGRSYNHYLAEYKKPKSISSKTKINKRWQLRHTEDYANGKTGGVILPYISPCHVENISWSHAILERPCTLY